MGDKIVFESCREMPIRAMSVADMMWNLTGSWRNVRPYYEFKMSPCRAGCPAGEDIQRYIFLLTEGREEEAWRAVMETNPMPAVTGRVCFHPCMEKCTRKDFDEAVNIPGIERAIGDAGLRNRGWMEKVEVSRKEKVAVVGGGPAGLTCAFYLARRGYPVTLFESEKVLGGVLRWGIPEYRLPNAILDDVISSIVDSGPIAVEAGTALGRDVSLEDLENDFDAVFLAMGLSRSRTLGLKGEEGAGVERGLDFLRGINGGGGIDPGARVVVVGGGNTAMDVARCALRAGSETTVVYRRTENEMPAIRDEIEEAKAEGVGFRFLAAPMEIVREKGRLKEVVFQQMKLGKPDETGRRRPVPVEGETFALPADRLFTAIGEAADLEAVDGTVDTERDLIRTSGPSGETSKKGIFAGGDVVTGAASVVEAVAAGRRAAEKIARLLSGEKDPAEEERKVVGIEDMNTAYFEHAKRTAVPRITSGEAVAGFEEIYSGFEPEMLAREAGRCFSCGVCNFCDNCWMFCPDVAIRRLEDEYEIDYDYCKGCLVCVVECPRNCISTREEGK